MIRANMAMPVFIKNLLSVYSANVFNGIFGIIAIPLIVSALGKELYGVFSIYAVLASYVALVDCGVTKHFVRLIASDTGAANKTACLQKALGWYLVLAVLLIATLPLIVYFVSAFLFPVAPVYQTELRRIVIFAVVEFCLSIPTMMSQTLTVSNEDFRQLSKFNVITGCYRYGLMILAAFVFKQPSMVVAFLVFRRVIDIYVAKQILRWPDKLDWHPQINLREFKTILAQSSILSLAQFLQTTIVAIGSVLVNRTFGILVLGNYRAAFDLGGKIWFLSNGIGMLLFPKFSKILADQLDRKRIADRIYKVLGKSWFLYLLISLCSILLAKYILPVIKLDSEQILLFFIILFVGICINAHSNVSYEFLLADGRYGTVAKLSIGGLLLIWIVFQVLKGITGPYAIAWAWVVSQSAYALLADELVITMNRSRGHFREMGLLLTKFCMLLITLVCLVAEIYFRGPFSIAITIASILAGLAYLLSGIVNRTA